MEVSQPYPRHSLLPPNIPPPFFNTGSLIGLEFTKEARLADQQIPAIPLSQPLGAEITSTPPWDLDMNS